MLENNFEGPSVLWVAGSGNVAAKTCNIKELSAESSALVEFHKEFFRHFRIFCKVLKIDFAFHRLNMKFYFSRLT